MCKKDTVLPAIASMHANTDASMRQDIATRLRAFVPAAIDQLALLVIQLHFDSAYHIQTAIQDSLRYYRDQLSSLIRKTDTILLTGTTLSVLLPGANRQGAVLVQERLWDALLWQVHHAEEDHIVRPTLMTIGYSDSSTPHQDLTACIAKAQEVRLLFEVRNPKPSHAPTQSEHKKEDLSQRARQLGIPYLANLPRPLPTRLLHIVRPALAQELHCYPLGKERNTLTVAISDPQDDQILTRLRQETGLCIFPILVPSQELQTALEQFI
ncbi:hypothetical protein [Dictyobacter arantiisoli]|uniref:Type II secretion system protein GspE N-terminal domain-containing protein n=1 Tax=Dictyobacter arantiisoli TaxID=2014874 RepID=A0A5A5TG00_9CHLR|nr:hypothetical protein [Dictyobacter arantiisoli]GCF10501.1 hypothetical protein KDI_40650 [Dictyobacter arantiisoli]